MLQAVATQALFDNGTWISKIDDNSYSTTILFPPGFHLKTASSWVCLEYTVVHMLKSYC